MALDKLVKEIKKAHGDDSIVALTDAARLVPRFPSGSIGLDVALGGGLPIGTIIEIYGPESSGKSTLALHAMANAQKQFPERGLVYIDGEHAFSPTYAETIGVNLNHNFLLSQPATLEEGLDIADRAARSSDVSLIVLDSSNSLPARAEMEGDMGDAHVGLAARLFSQALRKITGNARKNNVTWIIISQLRQKIGVTWGSNEVVGVGNALKFYASVRIDIRRIKTEREKGGVAISNRTKATVKKNKTAPPYGEAEFSIVYGVGIHQARELAELAVEHSIVGKNGAWYTFADENGEILVKEHGIEKFADALTSEHAKKLGDLLYEKIS